MPGTWTFGIKSFIYSPNKKNPKDGYLQFIYDYQVSLAKKQKNILLYPASINHANN